jgi:hypothetical protein
MLSAAENPLFGTTFSESSAPMILRGKEYRLATYLGAKVLRIGGGRPLRQAGPIHADGRVAGYLRDKSCGLPSAALCPAPPREPGLPRALQIGKRGEKPRWISRPTWASFSNMNMRNASFSMVYIMNRLLWITPLGQFLRKNTPICRGQRFEKPQQHPLIHRQSPNSAFPKLKRHLIVGASAKRTVMSPNHKVSDFLVP